MQTFITAGFPEIVRQKGKGKMGKVAKAAGISRSTLYRKLEEGSFTIAELKGMDRVLDFTREERETIWY